MLSKLNIRISPLRGIFLVTSFILLSYLTCFHYTDYHTSAISRNLITGETSVDTVAGFNLTAPWVQVARIDTRPHRICITSSTRNFNCYLVEFVPSEYNELIELEGFRYYWWANRISFNFGHDEEYRGIRDIFRGYTFDDKPQPFLKITKEQN